MRCRCRASRSAARARVSRRDVGKALGEAVARGRSSPEVDAWASSRRRRSPRIHGRVCSTRCREDIRDHRPAPVDDFVGLHLHRCPRRLANGAARGAQDRPPADPRKRGREPSTRSSTSGLSRTAPTRSRRYGSSSICRKPDRRGSKVSGTFKAHGELRSARTLASRCDERLGWRTFCACVKGARHLQNRSKYTNLGSAGRQTEPANLQ